MHKLMTYKKRVFLIFLVLLFTFVSCSSNNSEPEKQIASSEKELGSELNYDKIIDNILNDYYYKNDSKKIEIIVYEGSEFDIGNNPIVYDENEGSKGTVDLGKIFPAYRSYGMDPRYETAGWEAVLNGKALVDESLFDADTSRSQYTYIAYSDGGYGLFFCTDNGNTVSDSWADLHSGQVFFRSDLILTDFYVSYSTFDMQIEDVLKQETVKTQLLESDLNLEQTKILAIDNIGHFWGAGIIFYDDNTEYFMPLNDYLHNINDALGAFDIPTDQLEDQYKSGDVVYNIHGLYNIQKDVAPMEYAFAHAIEAAEEAYNKANDKS